MRKAALLVLASVLLAACAPTPVSSHYNAAREYVPLLKNAMGAGSGVVLVPGVVLTAAVRRSCR